MNITISRKIKYFYWFLTLAIVIFHSYAPVEFAPVAISGFDAAIGNYYIGFANRLGYIALTFFFFMSGFWLYNNTKTMQDVVKKLKRRVFSLLIPYLVWIMIFAVLKIVTKELTVLDFIKNIHIHIFLNPIMGVAWYLLSILVLLLIYPLLALANKNKILSYSVFFILTAYLVIVKYFDLPYLFSFKECWWFENMLFYMPVYLLGGFIALNFPDIILKKEYNNIFYTLIGILLVIASLLCFYLFKTRKLYALISMTGLCGMWFIVRNTLFSKEVPRIFDAEFFVFILHQQILLPVVRAVIIKILPITTMNGIEMIAIKLVTLIFVVLAAFLIRWVMEKLLPKKIFNLFSGGR